MVETREWYQRLETGRREMMKGYELSDGILRVTKDLRQDFDLSFDQACSELLKSKATDLVIDLSKVTYINSTYIGMIAATFFQAQSAGKNLTVRAPAAVLKILSAAGFDGFIKLEAV